MSNDAPGEDGEENPDKHNIFGTYISKDSSVPPAGIKKMLKRSKPNLAKTYISKCDLIVYDLHSGNPEDVQLALEAMEKPRPDDDNTQEKTIILISSLLAWDQTPRNLEEIRSPEDVEEEERLEREAAAKAKADAEAARKAEEGPVDEDGNPIEKEEGEAAVAEGEAAEGEAAAADGEDVTSKKEGESAAVAEGDATVLS